MSTDEEHIAEARREKAWGELLYDGWQECSGDCGDIYHPDAEMVAIGRHEFCASCIAEAGLIVDPALSRPPVRPAFSVATVIEQHIEALESMVEAQRKEIAAV